MMKIIKGDVDISGLYLTELPEFLKGVKILGNFDCSNNKLTTLKNAPTETLGSFLCDNNLLRSLEGVPKKIDGHFDCSNNHIQTLKWAPRSVGGEFRFEYNTNTKRFTKKDVRSVCDVHLWVTV